MATQMPQPRLRLQWALPVYVKRQLHRGPVTSRQSASHRVHPPSPPHARCCARQVKTRRHLQRSRRLQRRRCAKLPEARVQSQSDKRAQHE